MLSLLLQEEGEILMGRVLVFGALVRSGALSSAKAEHQGTVVNQMLQDIKGKSYLPLAADPFLIDYFKQVGTCSKLLGKFCV